MARHVFEEDPFGFDFANDPGDIWPEVAFVVGPKPLSGLAEWLAWVAGEDGVESAAEWPSVETPQVIPDWGWGERSRCLRRDDGLPRVFLPFHEGAGVEAGLGQHEAHIKASAACAEGQSVPGT